MLSILPVDTFVPDPALVIEVVGDPHDVPPAVERFTRLLAAACALPPGKLEWHAFYTATRDAFTATSC